MACVPIGAMRLAHSTRASVNTSTRGRAGRDQHPRAFIDGGAGGDDVVDEEDPPMPDAFGTGDSESAAHVTAALVVARGLRRGDAPARQRGAIQWLFEPAREIVGQQRSLVEAAPPQAAPMQRHRNDDVIIVGRHRQLVTQVLDAARARPIDRGRTCDGESAGAGCRVRPQPWFDSARRAGDPVARRMRRHRAHRVARWRRTRAARRKLRSADSASARLAPRIAHRRAFRAPTRRRSARGASGRIEKVETSASGERGHT